MKRILGVFSLLSLTAALLWLAGCDSPNSPKDEGQGYRQVASYQFPAPAKNVTAVGDFAAVAAGSYGAVLLNVRDLSRIDTVMRIPLRSRLAGESRVVLDTLNHLFVATSEPQDSGAVPDSIFDYMTGEHIGPPQGFFGPYYGLRAQSQRNELILWGATRSMFHKTRICRDSDTSAWVDCPVNFNPFQTPSPGTVPNTFNRGQGFMIRSRDQIIALSLMDAGVFLLDSTGNTLSVTTLPGSAYDCAWYQDSLLVVAADHQLVILDAADVTHPTILSTLQIITSDRMRGVVLDGTRACILDEYDGIYVVDIANPRNPVYTQLMKLSAPTSIWFDNGRLYATDEILGMVVYTR